MAEGDGDAVFAEFRVEAPVDLVDHRVAVGQVAHVQAQFVFQAAVAEVEEEYLRLRVLEHPRVFPGGLEQQRAHLLQVGAEFHADADGHPGHGVAQRPVEQLVGDEGLVRDDDFLVIEIGDGGGADADAADGAGQVANGHHVADAHRLFEEDDQAGDEVGEDLLQTEAQPYRQRGHQPLQLVPAHAERRQHRDDTGADQRVGQQRADGVGAARCQVQARQHRDFEQARQVARQGEGDGDGQQGAEQAVERDGRFGIAGDEFVQGDVIQVRHHADQVGPDPVEHQEEQAEHRHARQAQRLLVDLFDVQLRLAGGLVAAVIRLRLAFGLRALIGQPPGGNRQATDQGRLDGDPGHQQIKGVDKAAGEFQRGVVVAQADHHDQRQRQQAEQQADEAPHRRCVLARRSLEQQAGQAPAHHGVAGQHHRDAEHVVDQTGRLMLGDRHHGDQRQNDETQAADLVAQEGHLRREPAEVDLGHAVRRQHAVGGVEHQPGLCHLVEGHAQRDVLPPAVHLQQVAAQGQKQSAGQRQQQVQQQRQRRVQLTVVAEMPHLAAEPLELGVDRPTPPEQRENHQEQRQEEQRSLQQPGAQSLYRRSPGHGAELALQQQRHILEPAQVQRLVAGNPEHLLVEGFAQRAYLALQLLLAQLQRDGFAEQRVELVIEPVEQFAARAHQLQQRIAQLGRDRGVRLAGQQLVDMVLDIAAEPAPLIQLELVEPDIGDFVGEVAVQAQLGKCLFLLVEHLGQQQAAFEHRDLFLQGLVGLAEDVQLLARLQVPLSQVVEAFGRAQQVAGKASVLLAFGRQQLVGAGLLGLGRELRDGLLGFLAALVVDRRLQGDALLLGTGDLRGQQIAAALPQILQHAVARQLLPA